MIRERECCGQLCLYLVVFGSEITVIVGGLLFPEQVNVQNVKHSTQILNATVMSLFFLTDPNGLQPQIQPLRFQKQFKIGLVLIIYSMYILTKTTCLRHKSLRFINPTLTVVIRFNASGHGKKFDLL